MHADHCSGILSLISRRNELAYKYGLQKVILVIPNNMVSWYETYRNSVEDLSVGCELLFI